MAVERVEWKPDDEEYLRELLVALEKDPKTRLTALQFKLTVRQIRAQERLATAMDLFVATVAVEKGYLPAAEQAVEATRGPGRMRR